MLYSCWWPKWVSRWVDCMFDARWGGTQQHVFCYPTLNFFCDFLGWWLQGFIFIIQSDVDTQYERLRTWALCVVMPFNQYSINIQSFFLHSMNKCKTMLALTATLTSFRVHHVEWGFFCLKQNWLKVGNSMFVVRLVHRKHQKRGEHFAEKKCSNELLRLLNFAHSQTAIEIELTESLPSYCDLAMATKTLRSSLLLLLALFGAHQAARQGIQLKFGSIWQGNLWKQGYEVISQFIIVHLEVVQVGRVTQLLYVSLTFCSMEGRPPGQALCSANVSPVSARASEHPNIDLRALHQPHWRFPKAHPFTSYFSYCPV